VAVAGLAFAEGNTSGHQLLIGSHRRQAHHRENKESWKQKSSALRSQLWEHVLARFCLLFEEKCVQMLESRNAQLGSARLRNTLRLFAKRILR
jgi:hypothetical protein